MSESMVDYALRYARAGRRVIPLHTAPGGRCSCGKPDCASPGKHPRTEHGAHDASSDEAVIRAWWARWPDANIGMTLEDHVVVDEDPRNGGDVGALPHKLPETCNQKTGGGGRHFLYRGRNGTKYPGQLAPGIDCKSGPGAYIVVEPSVHATGGKYCWLDETEPWSLRPAEAPEWLASDETRAAAPAVGASIGEGGRNATLASLAGTMRRRGMEQPAIEAALLAENRAKCSPPLTDAEVRAIAASVSRYAPGPAAISIEASAREPVDILREFAAPAYVERDVPEVIGRYAHEFAHAGGFDPSMITLACVASAAAILDDRIRIRQPGATRWTESGRIWAAIVAPSAAGKSPATKEATRPIVGLHSDLFRDWLAANAGLKEEERTPRPALFSSDATIEKLADVLRANERGIIYLPDEFDAWLGQHDAYRANGTSKDRGEWLRLYDGGPHQVDRVKRGSFLVPNWGASILTTTTPTALHRQRGKLPSDGLLQRFIVALAQPMSEPQEAGSTTVALRRDAYGACLKRLYAFTPGVVEYTDAAATLFEAEVGELRRLATACNWWSDALASHVGKHPGMLARLTLTFHAMAEDTHPASRLVAPDTVRLAIRFMRKAFRHAVTLYTDVLGDGSGMDLARAVARFLLGAGPERVEIANRDLQQRCRPYLKADDRERHHAMEMLEAFDWLTALASPYEKGRVTSWAVNPLIHGQFIAYAAEQRRRRALVLQRARGPLEEPDC